MDYNEDKTGDIEYDEDDDEDDSPSSDEDESSDGEEDDDDDGSDYESTEEIIETTPGEGKISFEKKKVFFRISVSF